MASQGGNGKDPFHDNKDSKEPDGGSSSRKTSMSDGTSADSVCSTRSKEEEEKIEMISVPKNHGVHMDAAARFEMDKFDLWLNQKSILDTITLDGEEIVTLPVIASKEEQPVFDKVLQKGETANISDKRVTRAIGIGNFFECDHEFKHTSCNCDTKLTLGICTKCLVIACNKPCLDISLKKRGVVAKESKCLLNSGTFGLRARDSRVPEVENKEQAKRATDSTPKQFDCIRMINSVKKKRVYNPSPQSKIFSRMEDTENRREQNGESQPARSLVSDGSSAHRPCSTRKNEESRNPSVPKNAQPGNDQGRSLNTRMQASSSLPFKPIRVPGVPYIAPPIKVRMSPRSAHGSGPMVVSTHPVPVSQQTIKDVNEIRMLPRSAHGSGPMVVSTQPVPVSQQTIKDVNEIRMSPRSAHGSGPMVVSTHPVPVGQETIKDVNEMLGFGRGRGLRLQMTRPPAVAELMPGQTKSSSGGGGRCELYGPTATGYSRMLTGNTLNGEEVKQKPNLKVAESKPLLLPRIPEPSTKRTKRVSDSAECVIIEPRMHLFPPPRDVLFEAVCCHAKSPVDLAVTTRGLWKTSTGVIYETAASCRKKPVTSLKKNMLVLAYSSVGSWLRAVVRDSYYSSGYTKVCFIDYGSEEVVNITNVVALPKKLSSYMNGSIPLRIANVKPVGGCDYWPLEVQNLFSKHLEKKTLRVLIKFLECEDNPIKRRYVAFVKICRNGVEYCDVGDLLVAQGHAEYFTQDDVNEFISTSFWTKATRDQYQICLLPDLPLGKKITVSVAHVNDLYDFYVTRKEEDAVRHKLYEILRRFKTFGCTLYSSGGETGAVCMVSAPGGNYLRGRITLIDIDNEAEVFLIDTGEKKRVKLSTLENVPSCLLEYPAYAYHCTLSCKPPKGEKQWDPELMDKLRHLHQSSILAGGLQLKCFHSKNGLHTVEIFNSYKSSGWTRALIYIGDAEELENEDSEPPCKSLVNESKECASISVAAILDAGVKITKEPDMNGAMASTSNAESENKKTAEPSEVLTEKSILNAKEQPNDLISFEDPSSLSSTNKIDKNSESNVESATSETSIDSTFYTFSLLPCGPELKVLQQKKTEFFACSTSFTLNVFYIIPKNNEKEALKKAIALQVAKDTLEFIPKKSEVVCIRSGKGDYARCVVEDINANGKAFIRCIDLGICAFVDISDMKPVNADIMKFPPLGYLVVIKGVSSTLDVLKLDEDKFKATLKDYTFFLDSVEAVQAEGLRGKAPVPVPVELSFISGCEKLLLSNKLVDLQTWKWERLWEAGYSTDKEILSKGKLDIVSSEDFHKFSANCRKSFQGNTEAEILKIKTRDLEILYKRILFYCNTVSADADFVLPAEDSFLLVKGQNTGDGSRYKTCDWHRCYKSKDRIICIDHGEAWCQNESGNFYGIGVMRPLFPEFLKVPAYD